ncbi:MAG TPA: pyruvate, phosphate dikinase, partial [Armatimonadetes bacterium]|nr:pyruvate, phosphate dikinase [Armatimonadota bacterium]
IHGMSVAQGILTSEGGKTSHAAVVARQLGKPCVTGCSAVQIFPDRGECVINGHVVREGDYLSIDGSLGEVMLGEVPTVDSEVLRVLKGELSEEEAPFYRNYYKRFMEWVEEERDLGVWANADTPEDAALARRLGAEGIGLCRTEHMFFAEERLPFLQAMILAQDEGERRQALDRLRAFQREDFLGILEAMDGLPVTIRLLDPPLHEFLPQNEEDARKVAIRVGRLAARERLVEELRGKLDSLEHEKQIAALADALLEQTLPEEKALEFAAELGQTPEVLLRAAQDLHEANPMLGHRGCRLGITYPEIYEMQVRAIMEATCQLKKEGRNPQPEIMVPLVGHVNELRQLRELIERVLREVAKEQGFGAEDFHIPIGTMIELPRACVCADEIAQEADFFSFGTNDLTQTTFGISRDDAEGRFLLDYVEKYGILTHNPFEIIDREGVGELVRMGVEKGRSTKKDLKIGICGEHGGEPHSVEFCYQNDFTYVSCTSYRVPIARIAAAQARVRKLMREDGRKRRTSKRRTRRKSS